MFGRKSFPTRTHMNTKSSITRSSSNLNGSCKTQRAPKGCQRDDGIEGNLHDQRGRRWGGGRSHAHASDNCEGRCVEDGQIGHHSMARWLKQFGSPSRTSLKAICRNGFVDAKVGPAQHKRQIRPIKNMDFKNKSTKQR